MLSLSSGILQSLIFLLEIFKGSEMLFFLALKNNKSVVSVLQPTHNGEFNYEFFDKY